MRRSAGHFGSSVLLPAGVTVHPSNKATSRQERALGKSRRRLLKMKYVTLEEHFHSGTRTRVVSFCKCGRGQKPAVNSERSVTVGAMNAAAPWSHTPYPLHSFKVGCSSEQAPVRVEEASFSWSH